MNRNKNKEQKLDALILDGYVDEPSQLGVPPYLSPEPRYIAGVLEKNNQNWDYMTIDELRNRKIPKTKKLLVYGGITVPGNYLGGKPLTKTEAKKLTQTNATTYLGGPLARYHNIRGYDYKTKKDLSATINNHLNGQKNDRWKTKKEREKWATKGTKIIKKHPTPTKALMLETRLYRGCPRYYKNGCSFCTEPNYGKPIFREQEDIANEISAYNKKGIKNYRIGAQSCTISYKAKEIGKKDPPTPQPKEIKKLFEKIRQKTQNIHTLHLDNANPAIIAKHPKKSEKILKTLKQNTTSGNVLAFGLETADPQIIEKNNLNTTPKQTYKAIKLLNKIGRKKGKTGLPKLLPGLNFLAGLKGETKQTYQKNIQFLKKIRKNNLLLRRTNIRKILPPNKNQTQKQTQNQKQTPTQKFKLQNKRKYKKFKEKTREKIDKPLMKKIAPKGTVLKDVYIEKTKENKSIGRQIATYPISIKISQKLTKNRFYDIAITGHKPRSLKGIKYPITLQNAPYNLIKKIPEINNKEAAKIFRKQPKNQKQLKKALNQKNNLKNILKYTNIK